MNERNSTKTYSFCEKKEGNEDHKKFVSRNSVISENFSSIQGVAAGVLPSSYPQNPSVMPKVKPLSIHQKASNESYQNQFQSEANQMPKPNPIAMAADQRKQTDGSQSFNNFESKDGSRNLEVNKIKSFTQYFNK